MAYDVTVEKEINKSRAEVFNALMDFGGVKHSFRIWWQV